jgi:hypothetical protein
MDSMNMAVYASTILKRLNDVTYAGNRPEERWEPGPSHGLRDLVRVASAIGAIATFAGLLTFATH